jgi:hypothetical protein
VGQAVVYEEASAIPDVEIVEAGRHGSEYTDDHDYGRKDD